MKKKCALALILGLLTVLTACQAGNSTGNDGIDVISREQGSGTRTAFEELLEINNDKTQLMTSNVGIKDGNGLVATYIARNNSAIGYVSFATLETNKASVHGLSIDGVEASPENVINGTYGISRPFVAIYQEENLSEVDRAFIEFLGSVQGLSALEGAETIVDYTDAPQFDVSKYENLRGNMVLGGSTSTERAVKEAAGVFKAMFPQVTYSYSATGSGSGIQNAQNGTYTIGFSSRSMTDSELENGLKETTICKDGIVFIVNNDNPIKNISSQQIRDIYLGVIKSWDEL